MVNWKLVHTWMHLAQSRSPISTCLFDNIPNEPKNKAKRQWDLLIFNLLKVKMWVPTCKLPTDMIVTYLQFRVRIIRVGYTNTSIGRKRKFCSFATWIWNAQGRFPCLQTQACVKMIFPAELCEGALFFVKLLRLYCHLAFPRLPASFRFRWFTLHFGWQVFTSKFFRNSVKN